MHSHLVFYPWSKLPLQKVTFTTLTINFCNILYILLFRFLSSSFFPHSPPNGFHMLQHGLSITWFCVFSFPLNPINGFHMFQDFSLSLFDFLLMRQYRLTMITKWVSGAWILISVIFVAKYSLSQVITLKVSKLIGKRDSMPNAPFNR